MQDRTPASQAVAQPSAAALAVAHDDGPTTRATARDAAASPAAVPRHGAPVLSIKDLHVHFVTTHGTVRAVEGVSYDVHAGEMVAIVGESGSGKSVSALTVMRLLPPNTARIMNGSISFEGRELLKLSDEEMRQIRGRSVSMIFQEPMTSLNPVLTIGLQIKEPLLIHLGMSEEQATTRAIELLTLVGITDPSSRLAQYPHQLSGGM
ncbi:MAG TPA: ABC transporter ATP-binding protein, partial [Hyphomicrobiaceae bacterium]|nr:ABC transporter ATP-binding protein [Hyphomicrobiaceae bacterium]